MGKSCVVFLCDLSYFEKFKYTCSQLVAIGKYTGDICLVIGDDLRNHPLLECDFIKAHGIMIKHFPNFSFSEDFSKIQQRLVRGPHWHKKQFQFHKFHLFSPFFKQWEYILYLDCGISILHDISPILEEATDNTLLAHSDAYPSYVWKLSIQFDSTHPKFRDLNEKYDLNIDYFQTTIMLYDTKIINDATVNDLYELLLEYPISITNDQAIVALYFTSIRPHFKQIQTYKDGLYYYDYLSRSPSNRYIMLKIT